jgi:AcrR family transcriptional regulator
VSNQVITTPDVSSTRDRIVTEAIRLFARHGFSGTTVGDIEQAAGLAPRAGGLYKHFRSKEDVLSAAIERHVREMERMRSRLEVMPLGDVGAELTLAARWALAELGEEQLVMKVVQKDGDRFPELVREVHARIVEPGHAQAARIFERMFSELGIEGRDPRAIAAVALGALVDYRLEETMFGVPPGGVGEEEFIEAWVDTWESFARGAALPRAGKEK